jgi:hypothetical protein
LNHLISSECDWRFEVLKACFTVLKQSTIQSAYLKNGKKIFIGITRLSKKQFTPNSIFSFIQEKLVVWHFLKTIQTDIASQILLKTTLLKDIK